MILKSILLLVMLYTSYRLMSKQLSATPKDQYTTIRNFCSIVVFIIFMIINISYNIYILSHIVFIPQLFLGLSIGIILFGVFKFPELSIQDIISYDDIVELLGVLILIIIGVIEFIVLLSIEEIKTPKGVEQSINFTQLSYGIVIPIAIFIVFKVLYKPIKEIETTGRYDYYTNRSVYLQQEALKKLQFVLRNIVYFNLIIIGAIYSLIMLIKLFF